MARTALLKLLVFHTAVWMLKMPSERTGVTSEKVSECPNLKHLVIVPLSAYGTAAVKLGDSSTNMVLDTPAFRI
jgi:hypothetical protein